jgi:hypothetical protein
MKKVALLVLLVILATTLMAAVPTKVVRLTIINKSDPMTAPGDFAVYMKLTGSDVTQAYYYLTVPAGSRDEPSIKVFTVLADAYKRETWQCNGLRSKGNLIMSGNIRLTFTPCGQKLCSWSSTHYEHMGCYGDLFEVTSWHRNAGEPRMEKVTYFKWLQYGQPVWLNSYLYHGYWNFGCFTWYYRIRTYYTPYNCEYHYQY